MKMYIQQKIFRLADEFTVYGEDQQPLYYVYGKLFSFSKQLRICDINNREVGQIKQELFSFLPRYYFYIDNIQIGEIVKKFTLFYPSYYVKELDWDCEGDFWAHNYSIKHGSNTIATINKEWLSWGDFYTININDEKNSLKVLMVCLTIDACLQAENDD
ncbi:MAG TPA: LURP-one-related family protein [Erysipelotrichaceae bacterium]|jgi:uncharacterized protein YxjI|nr:hypothetical protein [Erysipelotrichia bacterium]HPX32071.1 LURP-one-related family protein [Erysipelotrichaceae bacterium]HQA84888.1 LURP-one-related family protein [Erysipelotrichaceae bacterium]